MELRLSLDDKVVAAARRRAEATGVTVEQLISDYLAHMPGAEDTLENITAFRQADPAGSRAEKADPTARR